MDIVNEKLQLSSANDDWLDEEFTVDQFLDFGDLAHFMMSLENLLKQLSCHAKNVLEVLFFQLLEMHLHIFIPLLISIQNKLHTLLSPRLLAVSFNLLSSEPEDYFIN